MKNTNKTEQNIRGVVNLPNGTGKNIRVAVMAKGDKANESKDAGADIVGDDDLVNSINSGNIDFDSLHYLKSRGIPEKEAYKMLISGFLSETLEKLTEENVKLFLLKKLEGQINGN